MTKCPHCNRPLNFAFKLNSKSKPERKLQQDIARAQEAIDRMRSYDAFSDPWATERSKLLIAEAVEDEIARLTWAIENPAALWRIYRRADKGESYAPLQSEMDNWESRVRTLEEQGCTRSDAQAVVDAEDMREVA